MQIIAAVRSGSFYIKMVTSVKMNADYAFSTRDIADVFGISASTLNRNVNDLTNWLKDEKGIEVRITNLQ